MTTMQLLMDLRYYLRSPFAEDNGALALLKNYKEWESAVDDLMKENDRLRDKLLNANQQCDHLSSSEGQLRDLVLKAFTLEVFEDGSIGIQTQAHKWICDMNLMRETEIAVRKIAVDEMVRRIESIKKKQVAVLSGGQKCKET